MLHRTQNLNQHFVNLFGNTKTVVCVFHMKKTNYQGVSYKEGSYLNFRMIIITHLHFHEILLWHFHYAGKSVTSILLNVKKLIWNNIQNVQSTVAWEILDVNEKKCWLFLLIFFKRFTSTIIDIRNLWQHRCMKLGMLLQTIFHPIVTRLGFNEKQEKISLTPHLLEQTNKQK